MTSFAFLKSEMDAAQALLDLQGDNSVCPNGKNKFYMHSYYYFFHLKRVVDDDYYLFSVDVHTIEKAATIARIFGTFISSPVRLMFQYFTIYIC